MLRNFVEEKKYFKLESGIVNSLLDIYVDNKTSV